MRAALGVFLMGTMIACADRPPDWVVYPDEKWTVVSPAEAGLDPVRFREWLARTTPRESPDLRRPGQHGFGVALTRGGYLVQTWGDADRAYDSASVGKAFTSIALQLAIDRGLIRSAHDPIHEYWTGAGLLDNPRKHLDTGHHRSLTWHHLHAMTGGFPLSNGSTWRECRDVPSWASCTGNPTADNYAHRPPGSRHYSSGGRWRLAQALTAVWGKDLKQVLDDELFSKIGIKAERWQMRSGREMHDTLDFYEGMSGYGLFCDPPYEIDGQVVRGGGGWVVMSPKDLARVALLIASNGRWKGERLISPSEYVAGHGGGNGSDMDMIGGNDMFAWGIVTADIGGSRTFDRKALKALVAGPATGPGQ